MPPVLNVAFDKLARGGAQQMFARDTSFRDAERHHVLKLVAETVRAAQLIERRARPYAASERLVEQPAIEHQIHARIGRRHLDRAEHVVPAPELRRGTPRPDSRLDSGSATRAPGLCFPPAPRKNTISTRAPGGNSNRGLQRGAGIEAGANFSRKRAASFERRGTFRRAVASEKFRAISSIGVLPPAEIRKGDASAKLSRPCAPRKQRSGRWIDFRDDVGRRCATRTSQHPFGVGGDGKTARAARIISQRSREILIGSSDGTNCKSSSVIPCDPCWKRLYPWPCRAMYGRSFIANRKRRGAPNLSGAFIAEVNCFAGSVYHVIVGPGRELIFVAVERPREAGARFRRP